MVKCSPLQLQIQQRTQYQYPCTVIQVTYIILSIDLIPFIPSSSQQLVHHALLIKQAGNVEAGVSVDL